MVYLLVIGGFAIALLPKCGRTFCLVVAVSFSSPLLAQTASHEEEVVRSTYATISFLCSLEPVSNTAIGVKEATQVLLDKEVSAATPVFEISHFQTGLITSIESQSWATRFSVPDQNLPAVLTGHSGYQDYSGPGVPNFEWRMMSVRWDVDNSYTPERIASIQHATVGEVVKEGSTGKYAWTTPAVYSRYATFEVTATFQSKTVGPYTSTFFFGKDAKGNEVVVPQDAITGQLLWDALPRQTAYPTDLIKVQRVRRNPAVDHWILTNLSDACSSARSDLCCSEGRCSLPKATVTRDLSEPALQ